MHIPEAHSAPVTEGLLESFGYGRGFFEIVQGANPGAGLTFSLTDTGQFVSRLISVAFLLTTDANVANRFVSVQYDDGNGLIFIRAGAAVTFPANSTQLFSGWVGGPAGASATGTPVFFSLPNVFLDPGRKVTIGVTNIQAGDTLTGIILGFERFPLGPRGYPEGRVGRGQARHVEAPRTHRVRQR